MSTSLTRYAFTALKLDISSLRANSIWDKSLVCEANISSASAHIERHRRISKIPRGIYLDAWYSAWSITLGAAPIFFVFRSVILVFLSVDMWASPTRYVLALLELDILSLRANSIWDKSLVCVVNISSRRHIELRQQHIENHARDLSRCVFSVKDNTLWQGAFFIAFFSKM